MKLGDVQDASERTVVDMEVATLRSELQLIVADHIVRGEEAQLSGWVGRNPAELAWGEIQHAPGAGAFTLTERWRWDAKDGALVYAYRRGGCLQLRLARAGGRLVDGWALGGGLILAPLHDGITCER